MFKITEGPLLILNKYDYRSRNAAIWTSGRNYGLLIDKKSSRGGINRTDNLNFYMCSIYTKKWLLFICHGFKHGLYSLTRKKENDLRQFEIVCHLICLSDFIFGVFLKASMKVHFVLSYLIKTITDTLCGIQALRKDGQNATEVKQKAKLCQCG